MVVIVTAPTGAQYVIEAQGYRAVVVEAGAALRELSHHGVSMLAGFPEDQQASSGRGQVMMPWPNRIEDGRYTFADQDYELPLTERKFGHASHGLVRWLSWPVHEHTPEAIELGYRLMSQPGYPWTLDLSVRYTLSDRGLSVQVSARNLAEQAAPYAVGAHPYLLLADTAVDQWTLTLPASTALETDDRMIPTRRVDVAEAGLDFRGGRVIGDTALDTAFTDLSAGEGGTTEVQVGARGRTIVVWMDSAHRWVQVFAGRKVGADLRTALAVEPMTAPPNAFATGEDLVVLAPAGEDGDRCQVTWGIREDTSPA